MRLLAFKREARCCSAGCTSQYLLNPDSEDQADELAAKRREVLEAGVAFGH